jgi:hypothetical protein
MQLSEAAIGGLVGGQRIALEPAVATEAIKVLAGVDRLVDERWIEDPQPRRVGGGSAGMGGAVAGGVACPKARPPGRNEEQAIAMNMRRNRRIAQHAETLPDSARPRACCRIRADITMKLKNHSHFLQGANPVAQRTFSIVKPDAVRKGFTGAILAEIDKAGFQIVAIKKAVHFQAGRGLLCRPQRKAVLRSCATSCPPGRWF